MDQQTVGPIDGSTNQPTDGPPSTFISTPLGYFQFKHHVLTDRRTDKQNVDDLKSELWRNKSEHVEER